VGDLDDLLVLHVADLDLPDAFGKPELLELGERLDGVDLAVLIHDRRVVALFDRRPDAEAETDALGAGDLEVGPVADADLVDLVEEMVGRVPGEVVGHAGLDAEAGERVLADGLEVAVESVLVVTQLLAALVERVGGVRLRKRHRRVEVVRARLEGGLQQRRVEVRRAEVADDVDAVLRGERRDAVGIAGIGLLRNEAAIAKPRTKVLRASEVVVGHHHLLEPLTRRVAAFGDGSDRLTDPAGTNDESLHVRLPPGP